eukprot:722780-Amphidinium_carterae.1
MQNVGMKRSKCRHETGVQPQNCINCHFRHQIRLDYSRILEWIGIITVCSRAEQFAGYSIFAFIALLA